MNSVESGARALYETIYQPEAKVPWEQAPAQHHHVCLTYARIVIDAANNLKAPDYWTPTADNINALPEPLRRFIHDLETNCDPAGIVADNFRLKQENAMLRRECENLANGKR